MKLLKKLALIFLILLLILAVIAFSVLFLLKNNEASVLQQQINNLGADGNSNQTEENPTQCNEVCSETRVFEDTGLNIELEYPSTWIESLNSKITTEFVYEPIHGVIAQEYTLTLSKGSADLVFEKILAAIDGFPSGLTEGTDEYVELDDGLIRVKESGSDVWKYVDQLDCSDFTGEPFDLSGFDVCIGAFFPGFGTTFATSVTINTNNAEILEEADAIALSAMN